MAVAQLPWAVEQYVDGMNAHDWSAVRASFADRFERIGPFPEHQFTDPDVYTQFLADLLPTIAGHTIEVTRTDTIGTVSYVTICERLRRDDTDVESYLVLACDLAPDGRLSRIEAFIRRTA
jgi:hypothetical protein